MEEKDEVPRKRKCVYQVTHEEVCSENEEKRVFWDFTQPQDLILVVEGKELHVNKSVLKSASRVFKVMLESESFVEKNKQKIELPGKKFDDVQELLNFLYPFWHKITDDSNVASLLRLSQEYEMESVKNMCEKYLLTQEPSIDLLLTAQDYGLDQVKEKCIDALAVEKLEFIKKHPRFKEMQMENLLAISNQRVKKFEEFCVKLRHNTFIWNLNYCYHQSTKEKDLCCKCKFHTLIKDGFIKLSLDDRFNNLKYIRLAQKNNIDTNDT